MRLARVALLLLVAVVSVRAQSNAVPRIAESAHPLVSPEHTHVLRTNRPIELQQRAEQIRSACVGGRRMICGTIIQIQPDGLVVESGYTSLLRPFLNKFWLIPGNISANRNPNEVESSDPGALCVGQVFLTDIPKKPTANLYDYVVLQAYPAGHYSYQPVTNVQKTIRRFSVGLETAVELTLRAGEK